jgi:hypothetical protein
MCGRTDKTGMTPSFKKNEKSPVNNGFTTEY